MPGRETKNNMTSQHQRGSREKGHGMKPKCETEHKTKYNGDTNSKLNSTSFTPKGANILLQNISLGTHAFLSIPVWLDLDKKCELALAVVIDEIDLLKF